MKMKPIHHQRGAALVELALILPLLLLITFITTEFGRALYQYNTITKSVRDAVRYLSVQTPGTGQAVAQNLVIYGSTTNTGAPLAIGLDQATVNANWQITGTAPVMNTVTVSVTGYCFMPLFISVLGVRFTGGTCPNVVAGIPYSPIAASMRTQL